MAVPKRDQTEEKETGRVLLTVVTVGGWLFLVVAACLFGLAKPDPNTFYDRVYYKATRQAWNLDLIEPTGPILLTGIGCTLAGFGIYLAGIRHKKYRFPVSLLVTGLLSAALYAYLDRTFGY